MSKQRTWQSWFGFFMTRGALVYIGVVLLLTLLQRHLIYLPSRAREEPLLRQAERDGLHPWRDREKKIMGWRTSRPNDGSLIEEPEAEPRHELAGEAHAHEGEGEQQDLPGWLTGSHGMILLGDERSSGHRVGPRGTPGPWCRSSP